MLKNIFFTSRFFNAQFVFSGLFILGFIFPAVFQFSKLAYGIFWIALLFEILILFSIKNPLQINRLGYEKLSNGDDNEFRILIKNLTSVSWKFRCIDEIPVQFQERKLHFIGKLTPKGEKEIEYSVRPTDRGKYEFGKTLVFISLLGLIERRIKANNEQTLACYPSFLQLRKYLLMATTHRLHELGVKRIRKIGTTMEFERIREYAEGDDYRFINWKATGKLKKLMVNQYEDEKSQPIYSIIDTGRTMKLPFKELSLLDYSINSALVLSNVALLKKDRAGLVLFSKTIDRHIVADKKSLQMQLIMEALYALDTDFKEAEFGKLYSEVRRKISQRALIMLYTNFETLDAMRRQLKYLRMLNKSHVLVVVIFKNTELHELADKEPKKTIEVYDQIIAEKLIYEKYLIIQELNSFGIQTIYTAPEHLTINSINKYLEIKARGLI